MPNKASLILVIEAQNGDKTMSKPKTTKQDWIDAIGMAFVMAIIVGALFLGAEYQIAIEAEQSARYAMEFQQ